MAGYVIMDCVWFRFDLSIYEYILNKYMLNKYSTEKKGN